MPTTAITKTTREREKARFVCSKSGSSFASSLAPYQTQPTTTTKNEKLLLKNHKMIKV